MIHFGYVTLVTFTNHSKLVHTLKKKADKKIKLNLFSVGAMHVFVKLKDSSSKAYVYKALNSLVKIPKL